MARGNTCMPTLQRDWGKLGDGSETPGRDLNTEPPKYEAGPRHLITTDLTD